MGFLSLAGSRKLSIDQVESRLFLLAAGFVFFQCLTLTFSPAARNHSWEASLHLEHWAGFVVWLALFIFLQRLASTRLPERDPYLLPAAALLSGWGLTTIWRLASGFGFRQTIWLGIALLITAAGLYVPSLLTWLRRYKYIWLTGGLVLLAATFLLGTNPEGSGAGPRMWLGCCGVYLQPSEPLKVLLVIYLAAFLADNAPLRTNLARLIAPSLVLTGIALLLLIAQRDLGTASIFLILYAGTVYLATGRRRVVAAALVGMLVAGTAGYFLFDVVRLRMDAWLNPWADPSGRSYQIVQSLIALASGGVFGKGLGLGSPGVIPVAQSDFIFAAIGEESGLAGIIALLALVGMLALRGLRIALRAPDAFQRGLAGGITVYLATQSILIIGGNLRLLPLTGVTLPFVAYGGSSLVTSFLCLLLLLIISSQPDLEPAPLTRKMPYLALGGAVLAGLTLSSLLAGWWMVVRSGGLVARSDNPRLGINDFYVMRGAILDSSGAILDKTAGEVGSYERVYNAPASAPVTGYNSPVFGRTGLEETYDNYLRGLAGNDPAEILRADLLYGQPPPGRDIRTSLNMNLQNLAYDLLAGWKGALVLMNASSGEILVMVSRPFYNPATLEEDWDRLLQSPDGMLLNRAVQGQYPAGGILGPFLLAERASAGLPGEILSQSELTPTQCASEAPAGAAAGPAISAGCMSTIQDYLDRLPEPAIDGLIERLGFLEVPVIPLETGGIPNSLSASLDRNTLLGAGGLQISPLQAVIAAAALSSNGSRPAARLVTAVNDARLGWTVLDQPNPNIPVFAAADSNAAAGALATSGGTYWSALAAAPRKSEAGVTWFIAGTLPSWQSTHLALVVLVEGENPESARQIGQRLMFAALGQ